MAWVVFVKAIFSCLNVKHDDEFLPYMPEVFNKTGHGLTNIIIVWDEFKPVLHQEFFLGIKYISLLCARVELRALHHGLGMCQKFLKEFRVTAWSKKWDSELA